MSWTDSALFLRILVAFRLFLWPSYQVSGRTWCKHVAPSTHPFHNATEGQTRLHCRSTHSWLSQASNRSSGMWRQEMLPSILHGCHFDTIRSSSIKNVVPDIFDQTSCTECCRRVINIHTSYLGDSRFDSRSWLRFRGFPQFSETYAGISILTEGFAVYFSSPRHMPA
jgi:hypothetical protein